MIYEWGQKIQVKSSYEVPRGTDIPAGTMFESEYSTLQLLTPKEIENTEAWKNALWKFVNENRQANPFWLKLEVTSLTKYDLNGDGIIDTRDMDLLATALGSHVGTPEYKPEWDFDGDGKIDAFELGILGQLYNTVAWSIEPSSGQTLYMCHVTLACQAESQGIADWILLGILIVLGICIVYVVSVWDRFITRIIEPLVGPKPEEAPAAPNVLNYDLNKDGVVDAEEYKLYLSDYATYLETYKGYKQEYPTAWGSLITLGFLLAFAVVFYFIVKAWSGRKKR